MCVGRIFTAISFSPSAPSRQYPTRYVFRAGCLSSTEEFRYLRTVRVTAAIHQYLSQKLISCETSPLSVIFWHWADVSMYISSYEFAHTCVLVKQSIESFYCGPTCIGHHFSLSYVVNLPNSLKRSNSYTLVYSTSLPVAVYGTVLNNSHIEVFPANRITRLVLSLSLKLPHSSSSSQPKSRNR